jgi:cation transport regulator ChaC
MTNLSRTFIYFAYGTNMLSRRLKAGSRAPSATFIGTGYVSGRRLTFDKVSKDGSGKCDIESTTNPTDRVYGVLFEIDTSEEGKLDTAEGLGKGYKKETVTVIMQNREKNEAIAYVATEKEPVLLPYHWYKAIVIAGAVEHKLPPDYIEWLRAFNSQQDPNAGRCAENEAILFAD